MNKELSCTLVFFLIIGLFVAAVSSISVAELIEDSWNTKTPTQPNRTELGVVAVDGKIYAIGGSTRDMRVVDTNECYNPVTDTWVTLEPMPTPRAAFAITVHEGKIYCMGGYNDESYNTNSHEPINLPTELYDPATNKWSTKASAPFNNGTWQAHAINGQIFVISANNFGTDDYKRDWHVYDPTTNSWSIRTRTPVVGVDIVSVVVNNNIMVLGTLPHENSDSKDLKTKIMVYNPRNDAWSTKKPGPILVGGGSVYAGAATTGLYAPKKVYFLGHMYGDTADTLQLFNWVYDPANDTWSTAKPLSMYRQNFGVSIVDDILYVVGGQQFKLGDPNFIDTFTVNEQYVPISYGFVPLDFSVTNIVTIFTLVLIAALFVITSIIIAVGIFFYFKKRGHSTTSNA